MMELQRIDLEKTVINAVYCIDDETRLQYINSSIARKLPSISEFGKISKEKVAIIGFGPSLQQTWEEIKGFETIFTCSGSHKFLLEKGMKPSDFKNWYHAEVDPHDYKCTLLGKPQKEIHYLIASACHPNMFDMLKNYDVKIWHLYYDSPLRNLPLIYPRNELIVTGGSNVGLRSLVLSTVLGYRDLHLFGFDCSFLDAEHQHADLHPNLKEAYWVDLEDKRYLSTLSMVHYAREFFHEIAALPGVSVKLHGNGLLQHWVLVKNTQGCMQYATKSAIAVILPELISKNYLELNKKLHAKQEQYGFWSYQRASMVKHLKEITNIETILDYGCGKGNLAKALPFPIEEYDPAIEGKDKTPLPADLVLCFDILEHVEPEYLDAVLGDLARCTLKLGYFTISTIPSTNILEDGRNAHLIQKNSDWWYEQLIRFFDLEKGSIRVNSSWKDKDAELEILVMPKENIKIEYQTRDNNWVDTIIQHKGLENKCLT